MNLRKSITRILSYYRRNGFGGTVTRLLLLANRMLFSSRMVLFYCDLSSVETFVIECPSSLKIEEKRAEADLSQQDLQHIENFWNPAITRSRMSERFSRGASLWLAKSENRLAGYVWTLAGQTIETYFFPLGETDVHLFDLLVFPEYRGRRISLFLYIHILKRLASDGKHRAFAEVAEWNNASLSSLDRTPFQRLGLARKLSGFRTTFVAWNNLAPVIGRTGRSVTAP